MVLSATMAMAASWSAMGTVDSGQGWTVTQGSFEGMFTSMEGVYASSGTARAVHPITVGSDGNFSVSIPFKLQSNGTSAYVGISTASTASDTSGDMLIGNAQNDGPLGVCTGGNVNNIAAFDPEIPARGSDYVYTATITSTDNGQTADFSIAGWGYPATLSLSGPPKYIVLYLVDGDVQDPSFMTVPVVTSVTFNTGASVNPSPSPSPSANPSPTNINMDLQGIRDFYAHQPVVHMSNQSVIYNPDGTIKQVITGTQTTTPAVSATPTVKPNVTTTATPVPVTPTAVAPTTAAPTKSQSPGFEIVLAAMGMIAALALITRKKK